MNEKFNFLDVNKSMAGISAFLFMVLLVNINFHHFSFHFIWNFRKEDFSFISTIFKNRTKLTHSNISTINDEIDLNVLFKLEKSFSSFVYQSHWIDTVKWLCICFKEGNLILEKSYAIKTSFWVVVGDLSSPISSDDEKKLT